MPSSSSLPQWRQRLAAVPEDQRCDSQRALLRAMTLVDYLADTFDKKSQPPGPDSDEPYQIFLAYLEVSHLPIKDRSVVGLMQIDTLMRMGKYMNVTPVTMHATAAVPDHGSRDDSSATAITAAELTTQNLRLALLNLMIGEIGENYRLDDVAKAHADFSKLADHVKRAEELLNAIEDSEAAAAFLCERGCQLTIDDLIEMSRCLHAIFLLLAVEEGGRSDLVDDANNAFHQFLDILDQETFSWYAFSKIYATLGPSKSVLSLEEDAACQKRVSAVVHRYINAAATSQPPDLLREAWASLDLAMLTAGPQGWHYNELESLVNRSKECMAISKTWIPQYFIKVLIDGMDMMIMMLSAARAKYPTDYRNRQMGMDVLMALDPDQMLKYMDPEYTGLGAMRQCANCGQQGRDMSACAAVSEISIYL